MNLSPAKPLTGRLPRTTVLRYAATRLATIGDQVVVSVANFGLMLAIGRAYSAEELASYGIGLSIGLMLQGWHRHAVLIPLMLKADEHVTSWRGGLVGQQVIVLAFALTVGGLLLTAAETIDISHYSRLIVGASVVCLITYLQLEFARAVLVKLGREALLLANGGWYALVVLLLAAGALTHHLEYWMLLAGLGAAMLLHLATITTLIGGFALGQGFRLLIADCSKYGWWSAAATATNAGYSHVPLLILGALAPPFHAAAFVATRSLMQPLQILLRGLDIADKSSFAKGARVGHDRPALHHTMRLAALYAGAAGLFGLIVGIWADQIIALAYGAKFTDLGPVLIAWIPVNILMAVAMPFEALVYARQSFGGYYLVRGIASVLAMALSVPLVMALSEMGAIFACAVGWFATVTGTMMLFARNRRP
jgi:O-antigen/teichoic acid export membrane protein